MKIKEIIIFLYSHLLVNMSPSRTDKKGEREPMSVEKEFLALLKGKSDS